MYHILSPSNPVEEQYKFIEKYIISIKTVCNRAIEVPLQALGT